MLLYSIHDLNKFKANIIKRRILNTHRADLEAA